jgi:carbonic anhydrase
MAPLSLKKRSEPVTRALDLLKEGNGRFSQGLRSIETMLSALRLKDLAEKGQSPFAILVTCSDSRLPAEIVFDRGVGDLFVIRMAGNVVTPEVVASIEFAATQFKTPLCVVMGHSKCGAMISAEKVLGGAVEAPTPSLGQLLGKIRTPYEQTCRALDHLGHNHDVKRSDVNFPAALTHFNIHFGVEEILKQSETLRKLEESGEFAVVGAFYDLHQGTVTYLPEGNDERIEAAFERGELPVEGVPAAKK